MAIAVIKAINFAILDLLTGFHSYVLLSFAGMIIRHWFSGTGFAYLLWHKSIFLYTSSLKEQGRGLNVPRP